jgi:hypothetical protein
MPSQLFYIYALKDPSSSPAMPFYIGKGTGSRAFDHIARPDGTKKWKRIQEIKGKGFAPLVAILADDLSESQALKLESELISAFGVQESGGLLTNAVIPSGLGGFRVRLSRNTLTDSELKMKEFELNVDKASGPASSACQSPHSPSARG